MSDEKVSNSPNPDEVTEALEALPEADEAAVEGSEEGKEQETVSAELLIQLENARKEARENWEKLLRTQAEMENLRRRTQKELQDAHKFALEKFTRELLPVLDSLELGIQAASSDAAVGDDVAKLREGAELTLQQFRSVLEKFNIVAVDPLGERFNPELHQAMAMQPSEEADANTVIKVFQKGYLLNERLLRPAMVVVAQAAQTVRVDEQA
jgi:molecular chaperone GrpE